MSRQAKHFYDFGPFRVDESERRLLREGEAIPLPPKAFETLLALVRNSGHLLTKDELLKTVWPGTFVEENNLTQYVSTLRKSLGDDGNGGYIETVPRVGYRFAPGVREVWDEADGVIVENRSLYHVLIKEEEHEEIEGDDEAVAGEIMPGRRPWLRGLRTPARFALTLSILVAVSAGLFVFVNRSKKLAAGGEAAKPFAFKSIAVLPFQLVGGGEADEYLGLGIADTLITRLTRLKQISVRPTSAVQRYTGARDAVAAGRELGVDAVLDGRIQRSGGRVRVTAQLLSVRDGTPLWAGEFDENLNAIFTVQDALSSQVAHSLNVSLSDQENARLTERGTDNPDAYQAYMRGRFFWNRRTREAFIKAIEHFQEATRLDPDYAQAYAGLADTYSLLGTEPVRARDAALHAIELDDNLAEAHTSLASIRFFNEWNWPEAEREFRRSIELNPNVATTHHWFAYYLAAMGRMDESIAEIERARDLDPLSLIINTDAGQIYYYARRYDRAITQLRQTVEMDQTFVMAHWRLGEALEQSGRYEEAITELQKANSLYRDGDVNPIPLGHVYAVSGRRAEAIKVLSEWREAFQRTRGQPTNHPFWMATIYAALGERDQAVHWLKLSYENRSGDIVLVQAEPRFDSLRSDPRFTELLRRMKLTPG